MNYLELFESFTSNVIKNKSNLSDEEKRLRIIPDMIKVYPKQKDTFENLKIGNLYQLKLCNYNEDECVFQIIDKEKMTLQGSRRFVSYYIKVKDKDGLTGTLCMMDYKYPEIPLWSFNRNSSEDFSEKYFKI